MHTVTLWTRQVAQLHTILTNPCLLFAGLLGAARSTAAAASQLHRGDDDGAGLIHEDDGYHLQGGGLAAAHLVLKERNVGSMDVVFTKKYFGRLNKALEPS